MSPRLSRRGGHGALRRMPVVPDPITLTWGFETNLYEDNGNSAAPDPWAPYAPTMLTATRANNLAHSGNYSMHMELTPPTIYDINLNPMIDLWLPAIPKTLSTEYYIRWTTSAYNAGMMSGTAFTKPTDSSKFISSGYPQQFYSSSWTKMTLSSTNATAIANVFVADSGAWKTHLYFYVYNNSTPGDGLYSDCNIDDIRIVFTF